jgi:prolyl-tRNA synthetase
LVKTLICVADGQPVAVLVPGDRDLNEPKLARALGGVPLHMADDVTIERVTGAPVGFAGPVGLRIPVHADLSLRARRPWVTGGNRADTHLVNVDLQRDAAVTAFHDLTVVRGGDACPRCGAALEEKRGIEVGHVFKLGQKYSKAFGAEYLDAAGNRQTAFMGCYGIGVTRTLQAIVEQSHDAHGIIWPVAVAPYPVAVLPLSVRDGACLEAAEALVRALGERGVEALLDDRDERPGVKFKDADLIGFPIQVVVSERTLAQDRVELKRRAGHARQMTERARAAEVIDGMVKAETSA